MRQFACLLVFLSAVASASAQEVRTWTDVQGRKMQAQLVREVDGDVTFIKDGKLITFPLEQLSEADQKFIREAETGQKVEETARPAGAPSKDAGPGSLVPPLDSSQPGDAKASLTKQRTSAEERTWRDVRGKQTVGKFVRMHDGNVVLLRGGRVVSVPFNSLSKTDQEYLRDLLTARGEAAQLPAGMSEEPAVAAEPPRPKERDSEPAIRVESFEKEASRPEPGGSAASEQGALSGDRVAARNLPRPSAPEPNRAREMAKRFRPPVADIAANTSPAIQPKRQVNWGGVLIGATIGTVLGSLIGAVILRAAAHWVLGQVVAFGDAFVAMFLASLLNSGLGLGVGFAYGVVTGSDQGSSMLSLIMLPVVFLVQSGVISSKLDTDFGSACKVTLTVYAIYFAIIVVIGMAAFAVLRPAI